MSRLLILACSQRKKPGQRKLPAIERYDGPAFRVVRKYLRESDGDPIRILILSAKYGLITYGMEGLRADKLHGFQCRATHNLWVLLEENAWLEKELKAGTYAENYQTRVDNSTYRPLIDELLKLLKPRRSKGRMKQQG